MTREDVQDLLKNNKELPTLMSFYARFRERIGDPKTSAHQIAQIISADQSIASRVLRSANSPLYGLSNRITSIQHAIVIIGFGGIHYIALNMAAQNMYQGAQQKVAGFDVANLWQHSMATAVLSRMIARRVRHAHLEEMFSAGLLHDVGKVFILRYLTKDFERVVSYVRFRHMSMVEAEREVLGVTHAEVGALLLKEWQLPQTLAAVAEWHHTPSLAADRMKDASIVHLADVLAKALEMGSGGDDLAAPLNEDAWSSLGLSEEALDDIVLGVDKELEHFTAAA